MSRESAFQRKLIADLNDLYPGCLILKNDALYIQGIPDLSIFYGPHWAMLECKRSADEDRQPNQEYYIHLANKMSFGRFIYPENKEEVLYELQRSFGT